MRQAPIPAHPTLSAATPEARPMSAPAYKGSRETVEAAKVLQTNAMLSQCVQKKKIDKVGLFVVFRQCNINNIFSI